jgi:predicted house-cleaning noncanonical NTP pyrophosphatase (MazG superfamily)
MKYDKLVRDNIHEENLAQGIHSVAYAADEDEYRVKLKEKLSEEVEEFLASEDVKELADILEVVYALSELQSISRDEIERIRAEKENKKGAFKKRIILEESDWA